MDRSPSLVVTGAAGFIGGHLCAYADDRNVRVVRVGRRAGGGIDYVRDIATTPDWSDVVAGADWVVHLAARVHLQGTASLDEYRQTNVEGAVRLAGAAAKAGVKRFVFASTAGVAGTSRIEIVDERIPTLPSTPYAVTKLEAEERLLELASTVSMDVIPMRLPLVYGPGAPGNPARLRRLISSRVPLPIGLADNRRSAIAVANVVDAIGTALSGSWSTDRALYVEDGTVWSSREMAAAVGRTVDRRPILLPVPQRAARVVLRAARRQQLADQLFGSLVVNGSEFRARASWNPPLSPSEAIAVGVV